MGEEGCGSRNPTRFFINVYNFAGFYFLPLPWKNMERKGREKREDLSFLFLLASLLA